MPFKVNVPFSKTPGAGRDRPGPRIELTQAFERQAGTGTAAKSAGQTVITAAGYVLPVASAQDLGGVKVGAGLAIAPDGTLSAAAAETLVTLAPQAENLGAGNWRIGADFSAFGLFGDLCYRAVLSCSDPLVVVETNEGPRTTGKAFWTIYVPAADPLIGYGGGAGDPITLTATLKGVWPSGMTDGLPATWDTPALVG